MSRSSITLALVLFAISTAGCRKKTPVEEVSLSESGVAIAARDLSLIEGEWTQWRGPNGDGIAADQTPPTSWTADDVVWRSPIPGRGHSSPIVVGGMVVLATAEDQAEKQSVLAYDSVTGEQRWNTVVHEGNFPSRNEIHQKATNANSTLASDGERLIATFFNNSRIFVTALDLDGEQIWQTDIGAFGSKFGYAPSPALYESFVIVAADNFGGGYLAALDLESGDVAWRVTRGDASSYSSPRIATIDGVDQVLITGGDRLASYDPATGELLWETECISASTCGTVVTSGDLILASGGYPAKETICLDGAGKRVWSNRTKIYEPSMIVDQNLVFAFADNGIGFCWDASDGSKRWQERLGGSFSGSPVIAGGNIYVADLNGKCHVIEVSDTFNALSKSPIGDDCYASPAVHKNALYFRVGIGRGNDRREELVRVGAVAEQASVAAEGIEE
ncbi:MAG: PQQ-binding-like beta-propeller repeat protein [Planctomycetota bacterium]